jgi:outer membrane protein assembly factor BamD
MKKNFMRLAKATLIFIIIMSCLPGCSLFSSKKESHLSSPQAIYEKGVDYYQRKKYRDSVNLFQRVKEEYPLSEYALMAELLIADAYFSEKQFIEAEAAYAEFVNLHPTNPNLPYVIYQLGMCHFEQIMLIDRDQSATLNAIKEFKRLIAQFPSSKYAILAEKHIRYCRQHLAEHEFYIGHFYFKTKRYHAAMKRFETVAREYPHLGLDYKVAYYIQETKKNIVIQDKEKLAKEMKTGKTKDNKIQKQTEKVNTENK